VQEGFLEADVPVLKNFIVQDINANVAGRITNYSTSGLVQTWKLGATSQIDDNIKVRGSWSLDIRAPIVSELFSPQTIGVGSIQYPLNGPTYQIQNVTGGNPALAPEKAVTTTFGVVLTPEILPGFSLSLDWYSINIHGGIYTTAAQTEVNRCLQGQTVYCSLITPNPLTSPAGTPPTAVSATPANAASIKTSGLDASANYLMDLFGGNLLWEMRGNYTDEYTQDAIGIVYDSAGAMGPSPLAYAATNLPKARGTLSATYTDGPWSGTIQGRFLGAAVLTNGPENLPANVVRASLSSTGVLTQGAIPGNLVGGNDIGAVGYLDLRLSYQWTPSIKFFGAVDNFTDVPRPLFGNNAVYDVLGRTYRMGVRFDD
jgi:outer membrane receptor protein involved in Fe transport